MKLLDEVMTSDGRGTIVGFPSLHQVEVRLIDQTGLLILDKTEVTEVASEEFVEEFKEAKIQGVNLTVPEEAKEFKAQSAGTHTTQAQSQGEVPVGKNGKPLRGAALTKYLNRRRNEA